MKIEEKIKEVSPLIELLGEDKVDKLKDRIVDVIVDKIEDDLNSYTDFIFYPPEYCDDIIQESFETVIKKLRKTYEQTMLDVAIKAAEDYKNRFLKAFNSDLSQSHS